MTSIAIVAGEVSGDYLAAGLIEELRKLIPGVSFFGIAGPKMIEAGCQMIFPQEKLAVMGFTEALGRLPEIYSIRRRFRQYCTAHTPDLFIGVDAPDFNLGLEEQLKKAGIKTVHYVSPSVWAWRAERINKIKRAVDRILTLFPFEAEFYEKNDVPVSYVGHPLADSIPLDIDRVSARKALDLPEDAQIIAVLPGSRLTEVEKIGPVFCETIAQCQVQRDNLVFIAPMATASIYELFARQLAAAVPFANVRLYDGRAREVMMAADTAMIASGTAALEALLCKCPMVVSYRTSRSTWWYVKRKLIVDRYALPNHLAGHDVVLELYQDDARPELIAAEIFRLLDSSEYVKKLRGEFTDIHRMLRRDASKQAALAVLEVVSE
jgi:lipid-A-disaccharide synthase